MSDGMGRELVYLSSHATNRYFIPNWGIKEQTSEGNLFPDMPTTPATVPVSTPKKRGRKPLVREPEPRPDLTKEEMREKLIGIKEIESVTGIRYIRLHVTAKMIIGIRESSGKEFTINLDELYKAYTQCNHFTSPEVKKYIFMGHSPAVALLRYLKMDKLQKNRDIQQE